MTSTYNTIISYPIPASSLRRRQQTSTGRRHRVAACRNTASPRRRDGEAAGGAQETRRRGDETQGAAAEASVGERFWASVAEVSFKVEDKDVIERKGNTVVVLATIYWKYNSNVQFTSRTDIRIIYCR